MPSKAKLTTRTESTTTVTTDTIPKNASLTNSELDSNFLNLRDQSIAISNGTNSSDVTAGQTITVTGTGGISVSQSNRTVTIDGSAVSGGGGSSIGNLSVTQSTVDSTDSTIDFQRPVSITQNGGTGSDIGDIARIGISSNIDFNQQGMLTGVFAVYGANAQAQTYHPLYIDLNQTNSVKINGQAFPTAPGGNGQHLITDGSGNLSWSSGAVPTGNTFYNAGTVNQDGGSFALDYDDGNVQLITITCQNTGSKTMNTPSNMSAGETLKIIVYGGAGTSGQDGDLLWGSGFLVAGGSSGNSVFYGRAKIFEVTYDGTRYYLGDTSLGSSGYQ